MSRWILPLLGLAVLASLLLYLFLQQQQHQQHDAASPPPAETTLAGESGILFEDSSGGYSLLCPPGWTLSDNTSAEHMIRADLTRGPDTGLQIRLHSLSEGSFESYARSYVDDFARDMREHWGGTVSELHRRDTKLGPHRCYIVAFQANRSGGREWFLKEYIVQSSNKVVAFQCGTKTAEREQYEPVFDSIVESIRFTR